MPAAPLSSAPPLRLASFPHVCHQTAGDELRRDVRVLFVSEGNVCRSVIAEAVFRGLVEKEGLADAISCESKVRRGYTPGVPRPLVCMLVPVCGWLACACMANGSIVVTSSSCESIAFSLSALSQGVRDYNVGEGPDPLAVDVCSQCGISLDQSARARLFKPADDIVDFDLLAVMDKVLNSFCTCTVLMACCMA